MPPYCVGVISGHIKSELHWNLLLILPSFTVDLHSGVIREINIYVYAKRQMWILISVFYLA